MAEIERLPTTIEKPPAEIRVSKAGAFVHVTQVLALVEFGPINDWGAVQTTPGGVAIFNRRRETVLQVDSEGLRAVISEELQTFSGTAFDALVAQLRAEVQATVMQGLQMVDPLPMEPPRPETAGWDAVFHWYYSVPRYYCLTLVALAEKLDYSNDHIKREHVKYTDVHGLQPMKTPKVSSRATFGASNRHGGGL